MRIIRRKLREDEMQKLVDNTKSFPDLNYIDSTLWRKFEKPYVLKVDNDFIGACQVYELKDWIKIGPFVLLQKYHGKGYGKTLLNQILIDYVDKNVFIASSNTALKHLLKKSNFRQISSYFNLPINIKLFLIKQIVELLHINMITEFIRKRLIFKRDKLNFYIKTI